jgi:arabinofuranosyltransferase
MTAAAARAWLAALCAVLVTIAWANRFVQDDAYIVFRYAEHWARGEGLVWNPGERVEGYSSFLYTALLGLASRLGLDPVAASHAIGLACFLGSLLAIFATARLTFDSAPAALLTVALLGANYTFSIFATGGLETSLHAFLVCCALWLLARGQARGWPAPVAAQLSVVAGLLMLTRPDSAIPCAVFIGIALWRTSRAPAAPAWWTYAALLAPASAIVGLWLMWKLAYYGELLPNTYHVKVASSTSPQLGIRYLYVFVASYWLFPLAALALFRATRLVRERCDALVAAMVFVALWVGYILRIGGDFMEFRFMVPLLPALMLVIVATILKSEVTLVRVGLVALVLAGSAYHASGFPVWPDGPRPESRRSLQDHLTAPDQNWIEIGRALRRAAGDDRSLMIAVTPAGAIPYHSGLPSIDMLGLCDRWVARHGDILGSSPGHQRIAPFAYLEERGVHLVIGHPILLAAGEPPRPTYPYRFFSALALPTTPADALPPATRVVEMPVDDDWYLPMLYVRPHPVVERQVRLGAWRQASLAR